MRKPHNRLDLDVKYIVEEYQKGRSARNIGEELGVSKGVILGRLREQGIERRQSPKYENITEEVLRVLYVDKKLSTRAIAEKFGCNNTLISKRLKKYGIPIRKHAGDPVFTTEERKEKWGRSGPEHPNWKGGVTEVSNMIRNRVAHVSLEAFKRDGFACVECGGGEQELNAHHIRTFSEIVEEIREENGLHDLTTWEAKERLADMCSNDARLLDVGNLVTLCEDCHYEAHHGVKINESEAIA